MKGKKFTNIFMKGISILLFPLVFPIGIAVNFLGLTREKESIKELFQSYVEQLVFTDWVI